MMRQFEINKKNCHFKHNCCKCDFGTFFMIVDERSLCPYTMCESVNNDCHCLLQQAFDNCDWCKWRHYTIKRHQIADCNHSCVNVQCFCLLCKAAGNEAVGAGFVGLEMTVLAEWRLVAAVKLSWFKIVSTNISVYHCKLCRNRLVTIC